jgi:hypothetical protein
MSLTQLFPNKACCTVLFFLLLISKIKGAMSFWHSPFNQAGGQKDAFAPLPIVIFVASLKRR